MGRQKDQSRISAKVVASNLVLTNSLFSQNIGDFSSLPSLLSSHQQLLTAGRRRKNTFHLPGWRMRKCLPVFFRLSPVHRCLACLLSPLMQNILNAPQYANHWERKGSSNFDKDILGFLLYQWIYGSWLAALTYNHNEKFDKTNRY